MNENDLLTKPGEYLAVLNKPDPPEIRYRGKPLLLAEDMGLILPSKPLRSAEPGLRELVRDICLGTVTRAGVKAPRGGGKSLGLAFIEFYMNAILGYDWLNLGGSEQQAQAVFEYWKTFTAVEEWQAAYPEVMTSRTVNVLNNGWVRVLAASQKSIRSPHAGGRQFGVHKDKAPKGGGLTIDEECEADEAIVLGALPTVNTASPSVIIRSSTFHKEHGTFGAMIDQQAETRYQIYTWDCFDIAAGCNLKCKDCIDDFTTDQYDGDKLLHVAYCAGKAKKAKGWLDTHEIIQAWIEGNDREWFETEWLGLRPSSSGSVIKDRRSYEKIWVENTYYQPKRPCYIVIDWGLKGECCVEVWQPQIGGNHTLLECEIYHQARDTFIYEIVKSFSNSFRTRFVRADSSHPYCNYNLQTDPRYRLDVYEVNFQTEKERGVGALNAMIEQGKVFIPQRFKQMRVRGRNWRRKNGKIVKGDDHEWDAAICYFSMLAPKDGDTSRRGVGALPVMGRR